MVVNIYLKNDTTRNTGIIFYKNSDLVHTYTIHVDRRIENTKTVGTIYKVFWGIPFTDSESTVPESGNPVGSFFDSLFRITEYDLDPIKVVIRNGSHPGNHFGTVKWINIH